MKLKKLSDKFLVVFAIRKYRHKILLENIETETGKTISYRDTQIKILIIFFLECFFNKDTVK